MGMENTQTKIQNEKVKRPSEEYFYTYETDKYKVYNTSTITTLLELAEEVKRHNKPSILAGQQALDAWELTERVLHDREFNRAVADVLWEYNISWKYLKTHYLFFSLTGDDWLLFCPLRRRLCVQLSAFSSSPGEVESIVINIFYY